MIETDVLVVGAGPAGSIAAKYAAQGGAKVILIDKKSEIGSPKRCAEGIHSYGLDKLKIEPNPKWIAQEIHSGDLISADKSRIHFNAKETFNLHGYIVERKIFDKYLAMDAARAGVEIRVKTFAKSFERKDNSYIVDIESMGEKYQIKTKILIAANGPESKIAKTIDNDISEMVSGVQYEMCNLDIKDEKTLEMYFDNSAPGGYAWIFPKGKDVANVGLGILAKKAEKPAEEYLKDFVENNPVTKNGQIVEINIGGIPSSGFKDKLCDDNLLLVGDAAGQVNPLTGGGIITGMYGGIYAGEVASEAIDEGDYSKKRLKVYEDRYKKKFDEPFKIFIALRSYVESLSVEEFNSLVKAFEGTDFKNTETKDLVKKLFKVSPKAILKLGKILKAFI